VVLLVGSVTLPFNPLDKLVQPYMRVSGTLLHSLLYFLSNPPACDPSVFFFQDDSILVCSVLEPFAVVCPCGLGFFPVTDGFQSLQFNPIYTFFLWSHVFSHQKTSEFSLRFSRSKESPFFWTHIPQLLLGLL